MNIIRKIKLESLRYYVCKDNKEKELFEFIKDNLLNLKQVSLKDFPDYIFYFKDDNCIFIWKVFETKFGYNYQEIQKLIKGIVEQAYKLSEVIPNSRNGYNFSTI